MDIKIKLKYHFSLSRLAMFPSLTAYYATKAAGKQQSSCTAGRAANGTTSLEAILAKQSKLNADIFLPRHFAFRNLINRYISIHVSKDVDIRY